MWIFESPTNYSEMVSKISKSVFIISLIILYLFCQISEDFNLFLEQISFGAVYELGGIKLNFALLVVPLLMGILEHVFNIHDKITTKTNPTMLVVLLIAPSLKPTKAPNPMIKIMITSTMFKFIYLTSEFII